MSDITTARPSRNGVDVPTLFATLDAVKANPEIADFRFRAPGRLADHGRLDEVTSGVRAAQAPGAQREQRDRVKREDRESGPRCKR
jgi:hypothetical protein